MAAAATLAISLVARTARFERSMKRSGRSVRRMRTEVTGLAAVAAGALAPLRSMARVLAPLAGGAGFIQLARGAESFNQAMRSSQAIMGDLSDTMKATMERTAIEVAKTTKFSGKQATESFFFLASAGLDAAQSIAALPKVAQFAQAGMFDMALATDLLTDAQSALGLTAKDPIKNLQNMARVADVLVKANTLANASVQQFSEALTSGFAAELKGFNKDIEEGVAVLLAFADRGKKSAEASTLATQTLTVLTNQANKNAAAYRKLEITVFDQSGTLRNLADIVQDVSVALGRMSDQQKVAALSSLGFTIKAQKGIKTLLGAQDQIRKYEKALRQAAGTTKSHRPARGQRRDHAHDRSLAHVDPPGQGAGSSHPDGSASAADHRCGEWGHSYALVPG